MSAVAMSLGVAASLVSVQRPGTLLLCSLLITCATVDYATARNAFIAVNMIWGNHQQYGCPSYEQIDITNVMVSECCGCPEISMRYTSILRRYDTDIKTACQYQRSCPYIAWPADGCSRACLYIDTDYFGAYCQSYGVIRIEYECHRVTPSSTGGTVSPRMTSPETTSRETSLSEMTSLVKTFTETTSHDMTSPRTVTTSTEMPLMPPMIPMNRTTIIDFDGLESGGSTTPVIIGAVIAGVVVLATVVTILLCVRARRRKQTSKPAPPSPDDLTFHDNANHNVVGVPDEDLVIHDNANYASHNVVGGPDEDLIIHDNANYASHNVSVPDEAIVIHDNANYASHNVVGGPDEDLVIHDNANYASHNVVDVPDEDLIIQDNANYTSHNVVGVHDEDLVIHDNANYASHNVIGAAH